MADRGDRQVYQAQHRAVCAARGPASAFKCSSCRDRKAEEWAFQHKHDTADRWKPFDYDHLCRSCHSAYDLDTSSRTGSKWTAEQRAAQSDRKLGHETSKATRAKISASRAGVPWSDARRAAYERRRGGQ